MTQTCQHCRHFHPAPRSLDLSVLPMGECRESLQSCGVLMQTPGGQPALAGWISGYASVPANFPACGRFALPLLAGIRNGLTE